MATSGNDVLLVQNTSPAILGGLAGDDTYIISGSLLTDTPKEITISDTEGSNSIQLVGGLEIASSIVAAESLQFTLSNGVIINVNGANTFGYEPGGNATAGIDEPDVSYEDFVGDTLGSSVPTGSDTASGGEVTIEGGGPTPSGGFTIAADDAVQDEGDTGTTQDFTFTVSREDTSGSAQVDFAVDFPNSDADADDFDVEAGTVSFADGEETATATVRVSGDGDVEPDENFTVALTNPIGDVLGDTTSAVGTIENDDVASLSVAPAEVTEGDSGLNSVMVEVSLDQPALTDVTFDLSASAEPTDTANPGTPNQDFIPDTVSGTIPAGDTSTMVEFEIITDTVAEENETFTTTLSNPSGANIDPAAGSAQVTILDDDGITISLADAQVIEQDAITQTLIFTATLSEAPGTGNTVEVDFATSDGTATVADSDYDQNNGTLVFSGSQTTQTFSVTVNGDEDIELGGVDGLTDINTGNLVVGEFFNVELSDATLNGAPGGVTILDGEAVGNIVDDDLPEFTIKDVAFIQERNTGQRPAATVEIELAQPASDSLSIDVLTFDPQPADNRTATLVDSDYEALSQTTVNFSPGETNKTVTVNVIGDPNEEFDETINVALFNARGQLNQIVFDDPAVYANPELLEVGTLPSSQGTFVDSTDGAGTTAGTDFVDQNGPVDIAPLSEVASGDNIIGSTSEILIVDDELPEDDGTLVIGRDDNGTNEEFIAPAGFGAFAIVSSANGNLPDDNRTATPADGNGGDKISGLGGIDIILGGTGQDRIFGGDDPDFIVGDDDGSPTLPPAIAPTNVGDEIFGDDGDDFILADGSFTGAGSDQVNGGEGDDDIVGGPGQDNLEGGPGADDFIYLDADELGDNDNILDFEPGVDRVVFDVATTSNMTADFTMLNQTFNGDSSLNVPGFGSTSIAFLLEFAGVGTTPGTGPSLFSSAVNGSTLFLLTGVAMPTVASGTVAFMSATSLPAFAFSNIDSTTEFVNRLNNINVFDTNNDGTPENLANSTLLAFGINGAGTQLFAAIATGTAMGDITTATAFTVANFNTAISASDIALI